MIEELKTALRDKLKSGEINMKQNVICKMIRSLEHVPTDVNMADASNQEDQQQFYTRVIFCASEKLIKKFDRARKKNESIMGVPRNKKSRQ